MRRHISTKLDRICTPCPGADRRWQYTRVYAAATNNINVSESFAEA